MTVQIIDQPFRRMLHGKAGRHVPGSPYGPDIIGLLDQVWRGVKGRGVVTTGINHVVYDDASHLFAGVEAAAVVPDELELVQRSIELRRYAYSKYIGPYTGLPAAWESIVSEITQRGLTPGRPGLEIYGHWNQDESRLETEILIALSDDAPSTR